MSVRVSRGILGTLLLAVAAAGGCVAAEPEPTAEEQNIFERNCPHEVIDAVLACDEPGYGALRFHSHEGRYVLVERAVEEDLVGQQELSCRYAPDPDRTWESAYELDGDQVTVASVDQLRDLVARIPDLDAEARSVADEGLGEPMAVIRYDYGFWGRGEVTYEGLGTGLESFRPSADPDNEQASKTSFVIDETAYDAGFGGTYATGTSCHLTFYVD